LLLCRVSEKFTVHKGFLKNFRIKIGRADGLINTTVCNYPGEPRVSAATWQRCSNNWIADVGYTYDTIKQKTKHHTMHCVSPVWFLDLSILYIKYL